MTTAHKNTCVSEALAGNPGQEAGLGSATRPDVDLPSSDNLVQEYAELQERFQRTTNALASAAHDLKTPLSILNCYRVRSSAPSANGSMRWCAICSPVASGCSSSSWISSLTACSKPAVCGCS